MLVNLVLVTTFKDSFGQSTTYHIVFLHLPDNSARLAKSEEAELRYTAENEHLRYLSRISAQGLLANAGRIENGSELLLFPTTLTKADVETIMKADPIVEQKLGSMEILRLDLEHGGICPPLEPVEMITYNLVRYTPENQIASYKTDLDFEMRNEHAAYINQMIQTGHVILSGSFAAGDGGILIYQRGTLDNMIAQDPAIREGYLKGATMTIWLNKGTFCIKEK